MHTYQSKGAVVRTADAERFIIQLPGYTPNANSLAIVEQLIADCRDAVLSGEISSAVALEHALGDVYIPVVRGGGFNYMRDIHPGCLKFCCPMMDKHLSYLPRIRQYLGENNQERTMTTVLFGEEVSLVRTFWAPALSKATWEPSYDRHTIELTDRRIQELFTEMVANRTERSPEALQSQLALAAEIEWLSGQAWKPKWGSAGISQLKTRTLLEVVGIDSIRFQCGIDPNLEVLVSDLETFRGNFTNFFSAKPRYFPAD